MRKKSATSSGSQSPEQAKLKVERRRAYRANYHRENLEEQRRKNRERYHSRYKDDPAFIKRRTKSWKSYAERMEPSWILARSRKYRKPYANLSPSTRSKIREAYKKWAKLNWQKRVEYAREYRRKNPAFGLRNKIASARRSGDLRKLTQECLDAIIRAYGAGHESGYHSGDSKRGV